MAESGVGQVELSGGSLTIEDLVRVARDPGVKVTLAEEALDRVGHSADVIKKIVGEYKRDHKDWKSGKDERPVADYGVTTGFGEFKDILIEPEDLLELSPNILLSHASGIGNNTDVDDLSNYFSAEVVRAALVIRLNAFLKGHSGVRKELCKVILRMINMGIVPLVPLHGSVGSSGDLCPLAHLFVVILGHGRYYKVGVPEDLASGRPRDLRPATEFEGDLSGDNEEFELPEERVTYKEGLALTNGANFSAAMLALGVHDAGILANTADVALALSLEAICGCARAFDRKIHEARGLAGQKDSAQNVRRLLRGSRLIDSKSEVQDPYSLRCAPAVHGATRDAIGYARMVVEHEINAATDNPLFFPHPDPDAKAYKHSSDPYDFEFGGLSGQERSGEGNWPSDYRGQERASYSAANFHGQPVGQAADFLAIGVAELADIAERRTQALLDGKHSRGLPGNLVPMRGVNSGFMIAQYAAAGLVSENKVLTHPATVDSIPTSANSEDHVSMATAAGRKLLRVLQNSQATVAVELLAAAQAVEWRALVRTQPPPSLDKDGDDEKHTAAAHQKAWERAEAERDAFKSQTAETTSVLLADGTKAAFAAIRDAGVARIEEDCLLDEPIRGVRRLVEKGTILEKVNRALAKSKKDGTAPLAPIRTLTWNGKDQSRDASS